jgi:membrane-associated phospholipid phosphatase
MRDLTKLTFSFALAAAVILVSYEWLDRPIAFLAHDYVRQFEFFGDIIFQVPGFVAPVAGLALALVAIRAMTNPPLSRAESVVLLCGLSFFVAEGIKTYLKVSTGRTWPETWTFNNPSLIRDGVYGFFPFHGGIGFQSFPSGHTTAVCAIGSVLWLCYPKWRPIVFICVCAVSAGLVAGNYHFLSDVIAGGYLGSLTGWITTKMWNSDFRPAQKIRSPSKNEQQGSNLPDRERRDSCSRSFEAAAKTVRKFDQYPIRVLYVGGLAARPVQESIPEFKAKPERVNASHRFVDVIDNESHMIDMNVVLPELPGRDLEEANVEAVWRPENTPARSAVVALLLEFESEKLGIEIRRCVQIANRQVHVIDALGPDRRAFTRSNAYSAIRSVRVGRRRARIAGAAQGGGGRRPASIASCRHGVISTGKISIQK